MTGPTLETWLVSFKKDLDYEIHIVMINYVNMI